MNGTVQQPRGVRQHTESHRLRIKLALQKRGLETLLAKVDARKRSIEETTAELNSAIAAEQKFARRAGR